MSTGDATVIGADKQSDGPNRNGSIPALRETRVSRQPMSTLMPLGEGAR